MFEFGHKDVDVAPGTVFGLRGWWLIQHGLDSTLGLKGNYGYTWNTGNNIAECRSAWRNVWEHTTPHQDCRCGFYAYWGYRDETELPVKGVIEGWGRTCIGTLGFRCQYAQIKALCVEKYIVPRSFAAFRLRDNLEKQWNVPVFCSMTDMVKRYPVTSDYAKLTYSVPRKRRESMRGKLLSWWN